MRFLKTLWAALIGWLTGLFSPGSGEQAPTYIPPLTPPVDAPGTNPVPPVDEGLGPDAKGRIRIPEVEALGGDWSRTWWLAPWVLPHIVGSSVDARVARWTVRGNVGCNEHGVLGSAPGRGFEAGSLGDPMTVYSWLVPYQYRFGTDKYGRPNMVYRSDDHISDKLTRSTRAANGAELAAYLQANPQIKPIPDYNPGPFEEPLP